MGVDIEPSRKYGRWRRGRTGADSELLFDNRMAKSVEIFWLSDDTRLSYGKIAPGSRRRQHTFGGHRWSVVVEDGEEWAWFPPMTYLLPWCSMAKSCAMAAAGDGACERAKSKPM